MAKGKFSAKNRKSCVDLRRILAEREHEQKHQRISQKSASAQQPMTTNARRELVSRTKQTQLRGPRLGGVIFYTIFFLCILLFYTATYLGLLELKDWLTRYELAQPTTKSQEIFEMLFSNPDWSRLYDAAGVQGTVYESKEAFVSYMETMVGKNNLNYVETSTGLSKDKKYIVRLGDKKLGAFTLVNHNPSDSQTEIADWQLGSVEFYIRREERYFIQKLDGHTTYVNNVPLDDSFTIRISTTNAENYLPEGISGVRVCTQEISGLAAIPDIRVTDPAGNEMEVIYDASSRTFVEQTATTTISNDERELAIDAVKTYALYMIRRASEADVAKYFLRGSDAYNAITGTELGFVQGASRQEFVDERVTNFYRYSDSLFSVRVSVTLNQYRTDGSVKDSIIDQYLFFEKQSNGKWMCYAMTAVDVSKSTEKVRLTFMDGDAILASDFYDSGLHILTCPVIPVPEGKAFSGWMVEEANGEGQIVMNLVFQPDEHGNVTLPMNGSLEPMTLYPYFEDTTP